MLVTADKEAVAKALKKDDWNDYVIRCEGPRIQLWLNGLKTADYIETDPGIEQSGKIAVQIHGGAKAVASYKIGRRRVGKECASMCRSRWSPYH